MYDAMKDHLEGKKHEEEARKTEADIEAFSGWALDAYGLLAMWHIAIAGAGELEALEEALRDLMEALDEANSQATLALDAMQGDDE